MEMESRAREEARAGWEEEEEVVGLCLERRAREAKHLKGGRGGERERERRNIIKGGAPATAMLTNTLYTPSVHPPAFIISSSVITSTIIEMKMELMELVSD